MEIQKLYTVKVRSDFYKEESLYTKHFLDIKKADAYLDSIMNEKFLVPTIVYIEYQCAIVDDNKTFLLDSAPVSLDNEIFIDFAFFRQP